MRLLPDGAVFGRDELRAMGWSDPAISRAVRAGKVLRERRGQFTRPGAPDPVLSAIAAARARPAAVVSHRSALLLHGLPLVGRRPAVPYLTVAPRGPARDAGTHVHRATLAAEDVVLVNAVAVTSVPRTLVDVARSSPCATAVAAIDAALNRRLTCLEDIEAVTLRCWNWPGIRRAHRAIRRSDGRAESPLESISRLVISWLHLPAPDLQPVAIDQFGHAAGRLDFYWDEFGVAGEADGRTKYAAREVLTAEKERQEHLEDHNLVFVRWGWNDAVHHPHLLRTRLMSGFERGRRRDRSGIPRLWSISRPEANTR